MIFRPTNGSWLHRSLHSVWLPLCLVGVTNCVLAQEIRDPTRPPNIVSLPGGSIDTASSSGPQLQSVRISAHRASAIISGQQVRVGDQLGDNRVMAISENDVTLRGPSGVQILKLFPGISKRSVPSRHRHAR
jgi:MSHA biogenesis protein MshK